MCSLEPIRNIPVKSFRFKKSEYGFTATHSGYEIHVGQNAHYWWWDVEIVKSGEQIAESDRAVYKKDAPTRIIAKKRAVMALNQWRKTNA